MPNFKPIAHVSHDGAHDYSIDHLQRTASLVSKMASEFGCGDWGYHAGLWHNLGNYFEEFQAYINSSKDKDAHLRIDHFTARAQYVVSTII